MEIAGNIKDVNEKFTDLWNDRSIQMMLNKVGNRYFRSIDPDDIESLKMDSLWKALKDFDASRGTKFSSYLYTKFNYALKSQLKKKRIERTNILGDRDSLDAVDEKQQAVDDVRDLTVGLAVEYKKVLHQKFQLGLTTSEIGNLNGYSRETARRKIKNALKACKKSLA